MKLEAPGGETSSKSGALAWIWPAIVLLAVIAKWLGLVGGLVALGAYFWLEPKLGIWRAVAVSGVLALVAGVGRVAMLADGA